MRLGPGVRVGPYEVVAPLGAGGMAEVYRARDTRLGRDIALKVVNEALAGDPELVRRFEQEARLAGSLNHPNVVAVYDVGLHEGAPFFVTELLQGESLRQRLSRGRIPLRTALDWAVQMAQGLAAAHARGVIHRDVKPDNIFIGSDGTVKLLDFGIAKLAEAARDGGPHGLLDDTVTPAGGATRTGSVLGTSGYMSPEQVRGEPVDVRTDIFSLGAVVHEMLSGKRAFPGATFVESGNAILHEDPKPLPEGVPVSVAQVVRRCLEKDREQRFQSVRDVGFDFEAAGSASGGVPSVVGRIGRIDRRRFVAFLLAVVGVLSASVAGVIASRRRELKAPPLPEIERVSFRWGTIGAARFLPDGRVVFSAAFEGRPEELFVRSSGSPAAQALGIADARLLAASSNGELAIALHPRFTAHLTTRQGTLARLPSVGGTPREIADRVEYADWSPAGDLAVVRQNGADRILEFPPGHTLFRTNGWISSPRFSSKGDRIAFLHHPIIGSDMGEVVVSDLQGQTQTLSQRWRATFGLAWSPDGSEVWFTRETGQGNLLAAVGLDGKLRELSRSFSQVRLDDVGKGGELLINNLLVRVELIYAGEGRTAPVLLSWTDWNWALRALSGDGKVLFTTDETVRTSDETQRSWVMLRKTDGAPAQVLGEGIGLDLSPDGRWALVLTSAGKMTVLPTGVGGPRSIASDGLELARMGRWIPGSKDVLAIARAQREDHANLYRMGPDTAAPVRVSDAPLSMRARLQVSPDGRWAATVGEDSRLVVISVQDGTARFVPEAQTTAIPRGWSQDGSLWVTEGEDASRGRTQLVRLEPKTGRRLEERTIGPADPGGASSLFDVVLSPDGKGVAFTYARDLGSLVIVRGLGRSAN